MNSLKTLGQEFKSLRQTKGHWEGGEYSQELDGFQGRKFELMKELQKLLSTPGTPASTVLEIMGKPDQISFDVEEGIEEAPIPSMPGPLLGSELESHPKPYYLVYYWRGKHDYLWFQIESKDEVISKSFWYHAGE